MEFDEDHREKNILLAKNLNQVKIALRNKKRDLEALKAKLMFEQQRNSKLETDQVSLYHRIDYLKHQLDETFEKNTHGYIQLSQQLEKMHHESIRCFGDSSALGSSSALKHRKSMFLASIQKLGESLGSDRSQQSSVSSTSTWDISQIENSRASLSFRSFESGLDSTFVKDSDGSDSELNTTFITQSSEIVTQVNVRPLQSIDANSYVTVRNKPKPKETSKRSRVQKENYSTPARSVNLSETVNLGRGCRSVKRINYSETSFRRSKH